MFDKLVGMFEKYGDDDNFVMDFGLLTPSMKFFKRLIENPAA